MQPGDTVQAAHSFTLLDADEKKILDICQWDYLKIVVQVHEHELYEYDYQVHHLASDTTYWCDASDLAVVSCAIIDDEVHASASIINDLGYQVAKQRDRLLVLDVSFTPEYNSWGYKVRNLESGEEFYCFYEEIEENLNAKRTSLGRSGATHCGGACQPEAGAEDCGDRQPDGHQPANCSGAAQEVPGDGAVCVSQEPHAAHHIC